MSLENFSPDRFKLKWLDAFSFEINRKEDPLVSRIGKAIVSFFFGRLVKKAELEQHYLSFENKTILGRTIFQTSMFERRITTLNSSSNLANHSPDKKHHHLPAETEHVPAKKVRFKDTPEVIPVAPHPSTGKPLSLIRAEEILSHTEHTPTSALPSVAAPSTRMEQNPTTTTDDDIRKKFDTLKHTGFKHLTYDIMARAEDVDDALRQDLADDIDLDGIYTTAGNAQFKKKVQKEDVTYLVKGGIHDALANLIMNLFTPDSAPKGKIAMGRASEDSGEPYPVSLIKFYRGFKNAGGIGNERGGRFALLNKFYHNCENPDDIKPLAQVTAMLFFLNEWDGNCQNFGEVDGKLVRIDNAARFGKGDTKMAQQLLGRILNLTTTPCLSDIINVNVKIQDEKQKAFIEQFVTTLKNATSTFSNKTFCDYFFDSAFPPAFQHQLPPIRQALEERLEYIKDIAGNCNDTPAADGLQDVMYLIGEAERRGVTLKKLKDMSRNPTATS